MKRRSIYEVGGFTPTVYQGNAFEFKAPDAAFAERALANLETRHNKAKEAYAKMTIDLGKLKAQMHQDPVTQQWIENYETQKSNEIDALIQEGNYGTALRTAVQYGADIIDDTNIQNRLRDNEKLTAQKTNLDKELSTGKIDKMTYNYLIAQNEKEFMNRFDETTGEYKDDIANTEAFFTQSVKSIDFDKEIELSFQLISPKIRSHTGSTATIVDADENGNTKKIEKSKGGYSYKQVLKSQIEANLKERFANVNMYESLEQEYKAKQYHLEEIKRKLSTTQDPNEKALLLDEKRKYEEELMDNSSYVSLDKYLNKMIDRNVNIITNRAYKDLSTQDSDEEKPVSKNYGNGGGSGGTGPFTGKDQYNGGNVVYEVDISNGAKYYKNNGTVTNNYVINKMKGSLEKSIQVTYYPATARHKNQ